MAITKNKKIEVVGDLKSGLAQAQSVTFLSFTGLNMSDVTGLRRELANEGVQYQVVKKTLLGKALESVKPSGEMPALDGNIAITWSDSDQTASARALHNWHKSAKDRKDKIAILGGVFESRYMDAKAMMEIATIPDIQSLRGMFVNIINTPIQQIATVMLKIAEQKA